MQKIILGWLCVISGLLWGVKPIYDVLFNGRRVNQGYTPSGPTDYIFFLFPLLCIGGLVVIYSLYKREVRNSVVILSAAVILSALFHFFEIYFYGFNLPFGFIFLFTGTICMMIGSIYLFRQLRTIILTANVLSWTAIALFLDNLLLIVLTFLTEALPEKITNPILAILMVSIGFIWAMFGLAVLKLRETREPSETDEKVLKNV
ncbi:hypothetical protein [Niallia endozanthoxylica]|uniref:DUF998 domain-containing protein n=1 Tax=Niallia endozanthoxylica TaxID=2036016 RepID=A0A5J5HNT3_9BACI|nr:hypothetical protein [Niallia endozanthoxylica]KAA9022039.1 hypothetical protein F4V44_16080 [Niallia endozanthoxylica]